VGTLDLCATLCSDRGFLAARVSRRLRALFWIVVCMVTARICSDWHSIAWWMNLDRANPLPQCEPACGLAKPQFCRWLHVLMCVGFVIGASMLNRLALILSPVALAVVLAIAI